MSPARKASNALLRVWCAEIRGAVLSVGSGTDADGNGAKYRDYFRLASSYTTSEPVPTPLCDRVLDVRAMPEIADGSFNAVFCSGVLEHVDEPWAAVAECYRILTAGGVFLVGVPFQQPLHRVPADFWRFTEYGTRHLLRAFRVDEVRAIGDPKFPTTYWAKAVKA
jgi:SAM-dependent methyltransferase